MLNKKIFWRLALAAAIIILLLAILVLTGSWFAFNKERSSSFEQKMLNFNMGGLSIKSPAFKDGGFIPSQYACDGENINPMFEISGVQAYTKSLVLIMDDPDATGGRTWDHWLVFNISPDISIIQANSVPAGAKEGSETKVLLPSKQGRNSWNNNNYGGPCPPQFSNPHRYMFKMYALDVVFNFSSGATKKEIEKAMSGHILDQAVLVGLYGR